MKHKLTFFGLAGLGTIVLVYAIYVLLTGWLPFFHRGTTTDEYKAQHPASRFFGNPMLWGNDRIALLEAPVEAGRWRIQLIEQAQESIVVSYHTLVSGAYSDIFFGALFDAADRGVKVRFICDAVVGGMKGSLLDIRKAMEAHPNIELGLYEPLRLFMPWRWHNRLHDKFLVVDGRIAIMGGRNIADKLYQPEGYDGNPVYDRDVLIYRTNSDEPSVIDQILDYSRHVWNLPYMEHSKTRTEAGTRLGNAARQRLAKQAADQRAAHPEYIAPLVEDWESVTIPTNRITLVHNPLGRGSKAPWIWDEMVALFSTAKESVIIQSPYIVPLKAQRQQLKALAESGVGITYLTNSAASTPNFPGFSAYLNRKKRLLETGTIYEYMGPGSIHAKSSVVDTRISVVGSYNLDPRSLHLDTETMLVIDSEPFNALMRTTLGKWIDASAANTMSRGTVPPANPRFPLRTPNFFKSIALWLSRIILAPIIMLV